MYKPNSEPSTLESSQSRVLNSKLILEKLLESKRFEMADIMVIPFNKKVLPI
jgi:hypothetical protein